MYKKIFLLAILIFLLVFPVNLFAAETSDNSGILSNNLKQESRNEDSIEKGFNTDMHILGQFVRGTDFAAGVGLSFGYMYGGVEYDFYTNFEYFFNPGGGPGALNLEFTTEPGLRFEFEFFKREITSTSFILDAGYMMSWGMHNTEQDKGKLFLMANAFVVRPGVSFNFSFGNYETAIGIAYNTVVYPMALSKEYNGIVLSIKIF